MACSQPWLSLLIFSCLVELNLFCVTACLQVPGPFTARVLSQAGKQGCGAEPG